MTRNRPRLAEPDGRFGPAAWALLALLLLGFVVMAVTTTWMYVP